MANKYWFANNPDSRVLAGSAIEDMAVIDAGEEATFDVTVTGAKLGDMIVGLSWSINLDPDVLVSAHISAANTVTVVVTNAHASVATANFASATVRVLILPSEGIDSIIAGM